MGCYSRAIALWDRCPTLFTNRAQAYQKLQRYDDALQDCTRAVRLNAAHAKGYFAASNALMMLAQVDRSVAVLDEGLRNTGNSHLLREARQKVLDAQSTVQRLQRAIGQGLYVQADQLLEQYTRAYPEWAGARVVRGLRTRICKELGNAHWNARRWAEARDNYSEAIAHADGEEAATLAILYANRAAALAELGQAKEALADCFLAVQTDRGYAKAFLRRSKLCLGLQLVEAALSDLLRARALHAPNLDDEEIRGVQGQVQAYRTQGCNHYQLLQVPERAGLVEIRQAYRKAALQWHPDKCKAPAAMDERTAKEYRDVTEQVFKSLTTAHDVLSDRVQRAQFDQRLAAFRREAVNRPQGFVRPHFPFPHAGPQMPCFPRSGSFSEGRRFGSHFY